MRPALLTEPLDRLHENGFGYVPYNTLENVNDAVRSLSEICVYRTSGRIDSGGKVLNIAKGVSLPSAQVCPNQIQARWTALSPGSRYRFESCSEFRSAEPG